GAGLANDDLAGVHHLAAEALDAEPLGIGVPTVTGRGRALLVCHVSSSSAVDPGDLDLGVLLTVPLALAVTGLVLELDDPDLRTLAGSDHLCGHRSGIELGLVAGDVVTVDEQQRLQRDAGADVLAGLIDLDDIADGDLVLAATTPHDRVHA